MFLWRLWLTMMSSARQATSREIRKLAAARWLALLPTNTQRILKIFKASSLNEHAASADELLELPPGPAIFSTSAFNTLHSSQSNVAAVQHSTDMASIKEALGTLKGLNEQLIDKVDAIVSSNHNRNFDSVNARACHEGAMFFHKKFGETAYKCKQPCNYRSSNSMHICSTDNNDNVKGPLTGEKPLFLYDRILDTKYLIDSGSIVSLISKSAAGRQLMPAEVKLYAANGTPIATYGSKILVRNFRLKRQLKW